jgi:hypothetical protein
MNDCKSNSTDSLFRFPLCYSIIVFLLNDSLLERRKKILRRLTEEVLVVIVGFPKVIFFSISSLSVSVSEFADSDPQNVKIPAAQT